MIEASRVFPHIYQGSAPQSSEAIIRGGFRAVVLCAMEYQPRFPTSVLQSIFCPLDDATLTRAEWEKAKGAAHRVASLVEQDKRVLVTCMQGRNRSGLVSAYAIHLLTGLPGDECVAHVQRHRIRPGGQRDALQNETFVTALKTLKALERV